MDDALSSASALTFDCYGTLIDWDGGIRAALRATEGARGLDHERLLHDREREELEIEAGPYRPYGTVLAESLVRAAALQGAALSRTEAEAFAESMVTWPAFPDSPDALARLARRFDLAILSNVETRVLERSIELLGAPPFRALVTAEDVRSYKPARPHFEEALRRLEIGPERVLHVACSLVHDIRPAKELGWRAVWIDRRGGGDPGDAAPDAVFPDMASLADALGV